MVDTVDQFLYFIRSAACQTKCQTYFQSYHHLPILPEKHIDKCIMQEATLPLQLPSKLHAFPRAFILTTKYVS